MNDEYKDQKQRYAVCQSKWEEKKKKAKAVAECGDDDEIISD